MILYDLGSKYVGDEVSISWTTTNPPYELEYFNGVGWINLTTTYLTQFKHKITHANTKAMYRVKGSTGDWRIGGQFSVNPGNQMKVKINLIGAGDSDLDSEITVAKFDRVELGAELSISAKSNMRGYIDIIGVGDSDLESEIIIQQKDFVCLETSFEIINKYENIDLDNEIVVSRKGREELDTELWLKPSARMRGDIEIIEPIKRVIKIYPTKDSTVRESTPILNYGKSPQMLAGKEPSGKLISYLGFEFELPKDMDELISAKLVLNKEYLTNTLFFMGIHEVDNNWLENFITWNYRPKDETYLTQFVVPKESGKVLVDLTDYVSSWSGESRSFTIHPRNFDFSELTTFSTKESNNPPYIEIIYYETTQNANSISIDSDIVVAVRQSRDLSSIMEIVNDFTHKDLFSEITILKKEELKDLDVGLEVSIQSISLIDTEIEVPRYDRSEELGTEIILPYAEDLWTDLELIVNPDGGELDSEITVKSFTNKDLDVELAINSKQLDTELGTELIIGRNDFEYLDNEFIIVDKFVENNLDIEIVIGQNSFNELNSELLIENKSAVKDLHSEFLVRASIFDELNSELLIENKVNWTELDIDLQVRVTAINDLYMEVEVPKVDGAEEVVAELIVPYINDMDVMLEIEGKEDASDLPMIITLTQKHLTDEVPIEMLVRAFNAGEIESSIIIERSFEIDVELEVADSGGDYAFIM